MKRGKVGATMSEVMMSGISNKIPPLPLQAPQRTQTVDGTIDILLGITEPTTTASLVKKTQFVNGRGEDMAAFLDIFLGLTEPTTTTGQACQTHSWTIF